MFWVCLRIVCDMIFHHPDNDRDILYRMIGAMLMSVSVLTVLGIVVFFLTGCVPIGTTQRKTSTPPAAPTRSQENVENAKKVAGAITDKARQANERGMVPKSTDSGMLVTLAEANEVYVGSPDKRVDTTSEKAVAALIGAMQRQEAQYREDRAAWEAKIDAMSRDRDQYKTEVTTMDGIIAKLKFWLTLAAIAIGLACVFIPGLWLFILKFVAGRAKAQFVTTVKGIQEFREANRDIAPKLDAYLKANQDNDTQDAVIDIKAKLKKRKAA